MTDNLYDQPVPTPQPLPQAPESFKQAAAARLADLFQQTGHDVKKSAEDVAAYTAERAAVLVAAVGEPGYQDLLKVERDNVVLFAGISAVNAADVADARLLSVVRDVLKAGVAAIAAS